MPFRNVPIQRKVTASLLLVSVVVLCLTCASFVAYELVTFRQTTLRQLSTLGQVIAANSTAALAFENQSDANEILAALGAEKHIVAGCLYDRDGKVLARYPAGVTDDSCPTTPGQEGYRFEKSHLAGFQPVAQKGNSPVGTLYLKSDLGAMRERFRLYGQTVVLVVLVSLIAAYLLSTVLQRQISGPILALASTAHAVADRKDYSVRATKLGRDELGLLTDAFNQMLGQIDEQDRALRESQDRLHLALKSSGVGTWSWDIHDNRMVWDDFIPPLFGLEPGVFSGTYDAFLDLVHPEDRDRVQQEIQVAIESSGAYDSSYRTLWPDGTIRNLSSRGKVFRARDGGRVRMTGVCWDITERTLAEERLHALLAELERSNKELELFAYVASHDLQEPLRMVSSYTQLLERRYKDKLDDDAREFIAYAVDGASRMQRLINDLLELSRVSTRGKPLEPVDVNEVLGTVRLNLSSAMEHAQALVTNDPLPTVLADPTQLGQLFQNLIGNAIKFRNGSRPRVHVGVADTPAAWVFSVRDNGIGIEPEYFSRIFVIFQRLHTKSDYPGTGIGLAICKRIVERHGGKIWVESQFGSGSIFYFNIPK